MGAKAVRGRRLRFQNPVLTPALINAVLDQLLVDRDCIHGLAHWQRVERNGLYLAQATGADADVVSFFALFHDACRADDGHDAGHGARGAKLARRFAEKGRLPLDEAQLESLCTACAGHTGGRRSSDTLVGCCWDADRLDLTRLRMEPQPRFMSTKPAQEMAPAGAFHKLEGYRHPRFGR